MIRIAMLAALLGAQDDLEPIDSELAAAIGDFIIAEAEKIQKPRLKIDADSATAVGLHVPEEYGLMVAPQKGLAEGEDEAYRSEKGKPLGYLFIYRMLPVVDGKELAADKLHALKIESDGGEVRTVHALLLSVRRVADDDWRLYAYGPGEKPVLDVKFGSGSGPGAKPVAIQAGEKGKITLTVFDKYQADFTLAIKKE